MKQVLNVGRDRCWWGPEELRGKRKRKGRSEDISQTVCPISPLNWKS